jgi:hypothetical protein
MDRFFPEHSAEHEAQAHIACVLTFFFTPFRPRPVLNHQPFFSAYVFWDANIGPNEIGLCAAYASLARYVKGEDLYIPPRNETELVQILYVASPYQGLL